MTRSPSPMRSGPPWFGVPNLCVDGQPSDLGAGGILCASGPDLNPEDGESGRILWPDKREDRLCRRPSLIRGHETSPA